ncbi:MAG TPA: penicillin-binding protein 2 [Solirubrobacterales bacterium]
MYLSNDDRGPGMTSSMALRIGIFGGFALVLFGILFFRLWFLQILNGEEYLADANSNRTREIRVTAPRGEILDRDGNVIVTNRTSLALQVNPAKMPEDESEKRAELAELARLVNVSPKQLRRTLHKELEAAPGLPATLRQDVGNYLVYYLEENKGKFPGVDVERVFVRSYPHETLAAHTVGYTSEVTEEQLEEPQYEHLEPGDTIGVDGVEDTYDEYLRGTPGVTRIQVDAFGQPTPGGKLVSQNPVPGNNLQLTIDPDVQSAGEFALSSTGLRGAFITMDVHNGEILGMGSYPTYDPDVLTPPMTQAEVDRLYRDEILAPLTNRAIAAVYPSGSTFKIVTALAALENGVISPADVIEDPGSITVGEQTFTNAGEAANGSVSLVSALEVSSDVYFYELGWDMWDKGYLQQWAHNLGIGRDPGIDLPGAAKGLLPTQKWRDQLAAEGEAEGRPWSAGDNIQLATGQGDLQTNPLQMALAYATLGNGGTVVTPHVGKEIDDSAGRVIEEFTPGPQRHVRIDPTFRADIMEGLHDAAQSGAGTSYDIFGGFPIEVAGKTGTAERPPNPDQSWFAVLAPYPDPEIVTVVTFEEGGFGADTAAPAAKSILEAYFAKQLTADGEEEGLEGEEEVEATEEEVE